MPTELGKRLSWVITLSELKPTLKEAFGPLFFFVSLVYDAGMEIITRIFSSILNLIASVLFIAVLIVMTGFAWDYVSASAAKFWMASPKPYNVHMVDVRDEGRMNTVTCWYIEKEDKQFKAADINSNKCHVPNHVLTNWEDNGKNYRRLGFKFWAGSLVLFVVGSFVFCWLPARVIGFNGGGIIICLSCIAIFGFFTVFFTFQDVRAAFAPPTTWYVKDGGKIYSAEVKFNLQDKHGQVYYWSAGGTADATRVRNLGDINKNPTK